MKKRDWKILFLDDEEGIRKVVSITLEDAGYTVYTAPEGNAGLNICREKSPQIVITDVRMPGMDGIEVLRKIKEEDPNKEVIVVTGFGDMELAVRALQFDASDFITKPIQNEALLVALERAKERFTNRRELHDYTVLLEEKWMDTAEELARTFNYQENLIESSIDGILGCNREGQVVIYNKSLEKMLGYGKDEVERKFTFEQFFPVGAAEQFREDLQSDQCGGQNRLILYETNLLGKEGDQVPVQLSASVLFEGDEAAGLVAFLRDLRELRMLEQQFSDQTRLLQQHKMMSLGRLAASVVHEINNPLAGILNYLRLMSKILKRGSPSHEHMEKFKRYINVVEHETTRCSEIVSNLLAFSRKSELKFTEINIDELLTKSLMLSQHKLDLQNIQIKSELDSNLPKVWGDFNQIQQCLINLIFNAIDSMPKGGTLTLGSSWDMNKDFVEILVGDNGNGISDEDLPHIFDPFYTTKMEGKGLGLGLSTVYGIIDRHKGTINVNSQLGKGSVFTIKLPVGKT
ncbi:response regulator [Thermodesulfobacteriota bacterium]